MRIVVRGILSIEDDDEGPKYLLMTSKKDFGAYAGYYYPIGGVVKKGETQEQALIREFKEELNLDITPGKLITTTSADFPDQEVNWWTCTTKNPKFEILDKYILDVNYFNKYEMKKMTIWPATKTFFEKNIFNENED